MTALCRCAVGNVGLNVGKEKVESHITRSRIERFLEILWDYTQEGSQKRQLSKLEPEVEFRLQRARFEFRFGGISQPPIKMLARNLVVM